MSGAADIYRAAHPEDWRMALDFQDCYALAPVVRATLGSTARNLVDTLNLATHPSPWGGAWYAAAAYELARRAHRYARILEVLQ